MLYIKFIVCAVVAYLLGSINFAIIVSKLTLGVDIRDYGSGNAGSTNAIRTMGSKKAIFVVLGDILKGCIAVLFGGYLLGTDFGRIFASVFAVLGHMFPIYYGFKGGKGILTGVACICVFDIRVGVACLIIFAIVLAISKYVSLASMFGASASIVVSYILYTPMYSFICAIIVALIIFMHKDNIKRIISGTESKIGSSKSSKINLNSKDSTDSKDDE